MVRTSDPFHSIVLDDNRLALRHLFHTGHRLRLPILKEDKGRHGRNAIAAGDLVDVVDIDFGKGKLALECVLVGELGKDGRDGAAGRAPVCIKVYDDIGGGFEERVELCWFGDLVDFA